MTNNLCIFAKYRWWMGYKQYPSTSVSDTYSELFPKANKRQSQIIACVKDNKIYYAYRYKMWNGVVWFCFQHEKICKDFEKLFSFLNSSLNNMGREEILFKSSKERLRLNNIDLSNPKLRGKLKDYLKNIEKELDNLISANSTYLSNDKGGDITDEVIEYELRSKGSAYFADRINERYTVIILQSNTEREKKKQLQTNPPKKQSNNTNDTGMDTTAWITLGVIGAIILLNVIAPWFIPSVWPKLAVAFTGLGTYVVIKALDDNSNKKIYEILGWTGAIAILLSTVLTIYGLCGGFSFSEKSKRNTVVGITSKQDRALGNSKTPHFQLPKDFVLIPSGMLDNYYDYENKTILTYDVDSFFICKHEVLQKDFERIMGYNPSKFKGDSIPVHGMSVRDAVIYCNRRSEADGLRGFYEINGNVVTLKSDGNGYRLPTEEEWILASKKTKENAHEKPFPSQPHAQDVKRYDFKPHTVGEIQDKRRELFDLYGNVSELCVRSNGEIWGKGGSYRIALGSETTENGGLKAAENLSSTIHLNADFGLRLVFIP